MLSSLLSASAAHRLLAIVATLGILVLGSVGVEAAGLGSSSGDAGAADQPLQATASVLVCHTPGGDDKAPETVEVGEESELAEHLAHGDALGACDEANATRAQEDDGPADRIEICHRASNANTSKTRTLHIGADGVADHLAHGDALGECSDALVTLVVPDGKVAVCHRPGGNPAKALTLLVGEESLIEHLSHGDAVEECDEAVALTTRHEQQLDAFCERKPSHHRCD